MKLRILKYAALGLLLALAGIQFIQPDRMNPAIDPALTLEATAQVPDDVAAILDRACNDCHSSKTRWPWYAKIAPSSWLVASHVRDGRKHLSFSEWGSYPAKKQAHKLEEICEEVEKGGMPLWSYTLAHGDAKLSVDDRHKLCVWAKTERARISPDPVASE